LYLEFLYPAKFPLATEVVKFNSGERHNIFIHGLKIMLGKDTVQKKFDLALKIITVEGSPMLDKMTKAKYDCKLLFDPYVIKGQTRDLRGLTTFSEGFKNYSYVDLCVLEFYNRLDINIICKIV
jgi:hypothetical protein